MNKQKVFTPDSKKYKFYSTPKPYLNFKVAAKSDVRLALSTVPYLKRPFYEIVIGTAGNKKTRIYKNGVYAGVEAKTPEILLSAEENTFRVTWGDGSIKVYKRGDAKLSDLKNLRATLTLKDCDIGPFANYGICTDNGATGQWVLNSE